MPAVKTQDPIQDILDYAKDIADLEDRSNPLLASLISGLHDALKESTQTLETIALIRRPGAPFNPQELAAKTLTKIRKALE